MVLFGMLTPVSLAIAILRYKLWDIDLIIRKTLLYATMTGILALLYFGVVVLTQTILRSLTGNPESPLVIVLSTLGIAALFNPLRSRIQSFIDKRFYRARYNAEKILAQFATSARDEVDMGKLSTVLMGVVEESMQPKQVGLWIFSERKRSHG
jgi:hypothetical protein